MSINAKSMTRSSVECFQSLCSPWQGCEPYIFVACNDGRRGVDDLHMITLPPYLLHLLHNNHTMALMIPSAVLTPDLTMQ